MKNINDLKRIITIIACTLLFFFMISGCAFSDHEKISKKEEQVKARMLENADKNGYAVEFNDEKTFCIKNGQVAFYYIITPSKVDFDYCEFVTEEEGVEVKEGEILITIRKKENGNVRVRYHDNRVVVLEDGTEKGMYSCGYFISNMDFDKDSLVIDDFILDDKQKSLDAYDTIMEFVTVDELKEHYNEALSICNQLNE